MQQQGLINLDLTNKGNTLIYGQAGSGKENLLTTIVTSIALEHNPSEVNIYIMDFGSESLRILSNLPHVGDIATIENPGKVEDTFSMLYDIMEERKKLFADYSGSYNDYINNSGNKLPLIVVIINNYELFTENFSRLSDAVSTIYRDAEKYGIVFIITSITTSGIRSRIAQFFENKIALQLPDANQYRDVVKAPRELQPSNCFGRGLIEMDDTAYEFQTANVTIKEKINETIRTIGKKMNEAYPVKAKPIPTVPDVVTLSEFENKEVSLNKIPIGYDINTKNVYYYDASTSPFIPIVTENMTDERMSFVYSYIHLLTKIKDTCVKIIDLVSVFDKNDDNLPIYKDNFDANIVNIYNDIATAINGNNDTIYVFLGIGQLKKMLNPQSVALLNKLFLSIKKDSKAKFVFIDTYVSYKNLSTEEWYQSSVDATYGIWLGENVGTQLAININNLTLDDRKIDFPYMAFAVNNGKHKLIRYVVEKVEQNEE